MSNLLKLSAVATLAFALHGSFGNAATIDDARVACDKGDANACQAVQVATPNSTQMNTEMARPWWGGRPGWHRHGDGGFCWRHPRACR